MSVFPTTILLATDGSEEAKLATQAATELSGETGSEVHLVYVLPAPAQLIGHHLLSGEARESALAGAERDAETFLKEQAEQIRTNGGKVAETHFRSGDPDKERRSAWA
jgi:nucleotide-binding universal stress UspA family protein